MPEKNAKGDREAPQQASYGHFAACGEFVAVSLWQAVARPHWLMHARVSWCLAQTPEQRHMAEGVSHVAATTVAPHSSGRREEAVVRG